MTATTVEDARDWTRKLVSIESSGPGDTENAMRRLEARYGVAFWTFWSLRYKPPKTIIAETYLRIKEAYVRECERQAKRFEHEAAITKAIAGPDTALVRAASALAGQDTREDGELSR